MPPSRRLRLSVRFGLGTALGCSLALHLALAPLVRVARASALPEPSAGPLAIVITTPRPSPTPRPVATRAPAPRRTAPARPHRPVPAPQHVGSVPHVTPYRDAPRTPNVVAAGTFAPGNGGDRTRPVDDGGSGAGIPTGEPAMPTPTPTPKAACEVPARDARVVTAVEPETPELARERGATGDVDVRVDFTASGSVTGVAIARSADPAFDNAALDAARRSTYAPAIEACRAEPGSYLFRVRFD